MKISIITPVYNSASTIAATIKSIQCQNYTNVEHIIVDGASKDETVEIAKSFGFSKIISEPDQGIYFAMNKGVNLAQGDIIGILNSDDFYADENVLERVVEKFYESGADAVYGDLDYVDSLNTNKILRKWRSGPYTAKAFLFGWMPPHPTFFVKRSVYEQYGLFNTSLRSAADYEIMLRFIHKYKISVSYLPKVLVKMRAGGVSNASFKNRFLANREDKKAWVLNDLKPYFFTLLWKPIRKIWQFL
ncbi:glycosyl transferase [Solitalea longa]|uniref:Glycosyl transferase n=1 Tax=Solitalea longa TaxID=2079460 RepID=A0A2S5A9R9_9SPHI|nr:glycosyltransferase family 2 protein [Solitalea longa]POY39254.1 glycosyl transferase [Solitalea longa]